MHSHQHDLKLTCHNCMQTPCYAPPHPDFIKMKKQGQAVSVERLHNPDELDYLHPDQRCVFAHIVSNFLCVG